MPRFDVTTIGEGQLRYSVPAGTRLDRMTSLDVFVTGTEANVTCLLSSLGWRCGWISSLPDTPLGHRVANEFRLAGLDLSAVIWSDTHRLATYYVEYANPPRNTRVLFDRSNSCFTNLTCEQIDWDYLLNTRLLHLSGLSVPLSPSVHSIIVEAMRLAQTKDIPVSFDMNYRRNLWPSESAAETVRPLLAAVDLLFFSRSDARQIFGIDGSPEEIVLQLADLTRAPFVVTSLSHEGLIGWDRQQFVRQPARDVKIVDRIGAGDAMVAGVLHGWLQGDFAKGIRYGALTAALALSQYGDQVGISATELEALLDQGQTDIVR